MSPFVGPESTGPRQQPGPISSPIPERSRPDHRAACVEQDLHTGNEAWFEIYRAERVKLTSILFSGEDWRWRFCSACGRPPAPFSISTRQGVKERSWHCHNRCASDTPVRRR